MAATIKDVARETNLAISTISKYMNGGTVRKRNRILIEDAIKRLGYVPSSAARGLRTSRSYMIGVMGGCINNPHTASILGEVETKLRKEGYSLNYVSPGWSDAKTDELVRYLVDRGVDGIMITPENYDLGFLRYVGENQIPVVMLESGSDRENVDCVMVDCSGGAYLATEYLIKAGHRRIAMLEGPEKRKATARERLRGFMRAMEDYDYPVYSEYLIEGEFSYKDGYEGICRLWELEQKPTAVFIANYDLCLGAMAAIHNLGIRVPEELSVVSFDDFELSVMVRPKLTTVAQPLDELADTACSLINKRIQGDYSGYPEKIRLKPRLICRDSVKKIR